MQEAINENKILLPTKYIIFTVLISLPIRYHLGSFSESYLPAIALFLLIIVFSIFAYSSGNYRYIYYFFLWGAGIPSDIFRFLLLGIAVIFLALLCPKKIAYFGQDLLLLTKVFVILVAYLGLTSIAFVGYNSDLWSFLLYLITFLSYPICAFLLLRIDLSDDDIFFMLKVLLTVIFSHLISVLLYPLILGSINDYTSAVGSLMAFANSLGMSFPVDDYPWGDWHMSSLSSSNIVGLISSIFGVFCLFCALFKEKVYYYLLMGLSFLIYIMTDTKHTYAITIIGIYLLLWWVHLLINKWWVNLFLYIGAFVLFIIFSINMINIWNSLDNIERKYTEDVQNSKYELIQRSVKLIKEHPMAFLVGRSPGTYGSRIASSRAGDVIAKKEIKLPSFIPNRASSDYAWAMDGLYTETILVQSKSGAMQNPFASMIGIVMEMGIIGGLLFFFILYSIFIFCNKFIKETTSLIWKAYAITVMFAILYMIWGSIFEQYFEVPAAAMFFWSFIAIFLLKYRNHKRAIEMYKNR